MRWASEAKYHREKSVAEIAVAIMKLADLAIALDAAPLNKHKGCWEHDIDQRWSVYWNGHGEPQKSSRGVQVPAFTCAVHYNGWPAGLINPYGGIIAAGEAANENTFIAAIEAALARFADQPGEEHA